MSNECLNAGASLLDELGIAYRIWPQGSPCCVVSDVDYERLRNYLLEDPKRSSTSGWTFSEAEVTQIHDDIDTGNVATFATLEEHNAHAKKGTTRS